MLWALVLACAVEVQPLDALTLVRRAGVFTHEGAPFTGIGERRDASGQQLERVTFRAGRRHGVRQTWYPDGSLRFEATYRRGRRHGRVRAWWPDGVLRSEGWLEDGVPHGVQRQWYASGRPFKELRFARGTEVGLQRAWRENGAIYNNYEARDGRIFGLRRSKLCFQLDDEEVVRGDGLALDRSLSGLGNRP